MSVNGTTRWFALGLGAALLLPALGFAQQPISAAEVQKEREIAALKARLDELLRQVEVEPTPEVATQLKDLKGKLAQLMKDRAGAEFAGYAQEEARQRAVAELKRIAAAQVQFAPDADKAQAELQRAEAVLAQKAQEAKELEKKIHELQDRIKAGAAQVMPGAVEFKADTTFWQIVPQQASEEIVLRKVNGKWEVVNPKPSRADHPLRVIVGVEDKGAAPGDRPRIALPAGGPPMAGIPIEIRRAEPKSTDARIDELEKKMDKVLRQLEQLGQELHRGRSAAPANDTTPRLRIVGDSLELDGEGELKLVPKPEPKR